MIRSWWTGAQGLNNQLISNRQKLDCHQQQPVGKWRMCDQGCRWVSSRLRRPSGGWWEDFLGAQTGHKLDQILKVAPGCVKCCLPFITLM